MFNEIIKEIKELKIQGAENIAKAAIKAISSIIENGDSGKKEVYKKLLDAKKELEQARPTEPCLRNTLTLIFSNVNEENARFQVEKNLGKAKNHFDESTKVISEIGARKIRNGMVIFTHCHSSTVVSILKEAKKQGISFGVKNTETRPLFQGRITAIELAKEGVPVEHFVDSAGRIAIKDSDIMLIGADAITSEGRVINKVGSEMLAEAAKRKDIPVYVCTDSWKLDLDTVFGFEEELEKRFEEEVWEDKPRGVKISNYAFEVIDPELITGVISEIGIYHPRTFIEEMERHYPWLFQLQKRKILQAKDL